MHARILAAVPNNSTGARGGGISPGAAAGTGAGMIPGAGMAMRGPDPEPTESRVVAHVHLRVIGDVDAARLKKATAKGLDAARDKLPGRGSVRAIADAAAQAIGSRIRVELRVEGVGADERWARVAESSFAAAFIEHLANKGIEAKHVG